MTIFIAGQLFINYKHGLVVSPFYNFGMYSERFSVRKDYNVFEIVQNGKLLQGKDFSAQGWDKILLPLQYYSGINRNNQLYQSEIKRLLPKIKVNPTDHHFLSDCNYKDFEKWYKDYLSDITSTNTTSLIINYRTYQFQDNELTPTDAVIPLQQLCK